MADAIQIDGVSETYQATSGAVPALGEVSFSVGRGEFLSIVGPSGCGKSTLLKIVAGIVRRTTGPILLDGMMLNGPSPNVGVVFQSPVLLPWRTVLQNVLLPVDVRRQARKQYEQRARDLLATVDLGGFEDAYPFTLSGGMQQRAAICRALVNDPALLVMDEPFGALDALTREFMNLELLRIWANSGKTVLFVTHSIPEAVFLADRVLVMTPRPGRVDELVDIDLPLPRDLDTMTTDRFAGHVRQIRHWFEAKGILG